MDYARLTAITGVKRGHCGVRTRAWDALVRLYEAEWRLRGWEVAPFRDGLRPRDD